MVVARRSTGAARALAGPLAPEADPRHCLRTAEERPRGCTTTGPAPARRPTPHCVDPPDGRAGGPRAHPTPREPCPGTDRGDKPAAGPAQPPADREPELVDRWRATRATGPTPYADPYDDPRGLLRTAPPVGRADPASSTKSSSSVGGMMCGYAGWLPFPGSAPSSPSSWCSSWPISIGSQAPSIWRATLD